MMSIDDPTGTTPSLTKPREFVECCSELGVELDLCDVEPLDLTEWELVHDPLYVSNVLEHLNEDLFSVASLPVRQEVVDVINHAGGSMWESAKAASESKCCLSS